MTRPTSGHRGACRCRGESGQVGGIEVLPLGFLVFVGVTLLLAGAWGALDARMAVLAALRSVDWVVPFSEETPADLIAAVQPDVLVKGGDYTPESIAGAESVVASGGRVKVLDFVEGYSTSGIVSALQNSDSKLE